MYLYTERKLNNANSDLTFILQKLKNRIQYSTVRSDDDFCYNIKM